MFRTLRTVSGSVKGIQRSIHINAINLSLHVTMSKNMSSVPWRLGQSLWKSTVAQPVPELSGPNENDTFGDDVTLSGGAVSRAGTEVGDDGDVAIGRHDDDGDDSAMSTEMFRKTHHIKIQNEGEENQYIPFDSFDSTPFPEKLKRLLLKQGYTAPTPTQAQSWPIALAGRDIISIARTGSGKTCGFLMPAFHALLNNLPQEPDRGKKRKVWGRQSFGKAPKVLVLAPTRELAVQIEAEACKFSRGCRLDTAVIYGGVSKGPQIRSLRFADIVVGTPGRCNDLIEMGVFDTSGIDYLVLDEADRMLDMGFEPQIRQIVECLTNADRQTLFFTATWPREVQQLANSFLNNAVQLKIGETDGLQANKAIQQNILVMREHEKLENMFQIIDSIKGENNDNRSMPKILVFTSRKHQCEDIVEALVEEGYRADALHGDKSQQARSRTMDRFREGRVKILVATDVAARGLDVKDISTVINFDFPVGSDGVENYVHRIGRTARGDASGTAFTFVTTADRDRIKELIKVLKSCDQLVPDALVALMPRQPSRSNNNRGYGSSSRYGGHNRRDRGNYGGGGNKYGGSSYRKGGGGGGRGGGWKDDFNDNNNRSERRNNKKFYSSRDDGYRTNSNGRGGSGGRKYQRDDDW